MHTHAETVPAVALPRSVALHRPAELAYAGGDETSGIVHFAAPSRHNPGTTNTVSLDTYTGHIFCDCKGAQCDRLCWHACWVTAAWQAHPAVAEARALTSARLLLFGQKHARLVATYRRRIGRPGAHDAVRLLAARWEYRQRRAIEAIPLAA